MTERAPKTTPSNQPEDCVQSDRLRLPLARFIMLWCVLIAIVLVVVEGAAAVLVGFNVMPSGFRALLWNSRFEVVRKSWTDNNAEVDEELGWPSPKAMVSPPRDAIGAKKNLDFPDVSQSCVSAYGDSFIWGDEVPLNDGWIEQLSRLLGCRVSNFGVSGYGTDQAYRRFQRNSATDNAPVAMLGFFPENIMRNVNQYRGLMGHAPEPYWVKGRFFIDADDLRWIEKPRLDFEKYMELHRSPALVLSHEYLLPDSRDGLIGVRFPYSLVFAKVAMMPRVWTRAKGLPPYSEFFNSDHPSGALKLTTAIGEAFARDAGARGKRALIVMLPGTGSFRAIERYGRSEYAPLMDALKAKGIETYLSGEGRLA